MTVCVVSNSKTLTAISCFSVVLGDELVWQKIYSKCCIAASACSLAGQKSDSYEKFLDEAMARFVPGATRLSKEYKLGSYSWHLDQETAKLIFSKDGVT